MLLLSCYTTKAADGKSLFVTFKDGQKIEFALTTMPDISFENDLMTIKSTETTATYELWKVNTFTYGATTGINQLKLPTNSLWKGIASSWMAATTRLVPICKMVRL